MARNDTIDLTPDTWVQLTNANVSNIRIQNRSEYNIELAATAGTTAPTSVTRDLQLAAGDTLAADLSLAELWPGVSGANRVWALAPNTGQVITVSVSHG